MEKKWEKPSFIVKKLITSIITVISISLSCNEDKQQLPKKLFVDGMYQVEKYF